MPLSDSRANFLTTSSHSDDDESPIAESKGSSFGQSASIREYTIVNHFRPPRLTSLSVMALYEQIMDGSIKLDSDYQRDIFWPRKMYISLIDSIFRNYYIPPIIFAIITTDDGSEIRICIDGKKRLRSIEMFMDGQVSAATYSDSNKMQLPC